MSMEDVKKLRAQTGVSVMQCQKALKEAGGDFDKALIVLSKKSGEIAAKKEGRELGAGVIGSYVHAGGTVGVLVELACETDFVAKNEDFVKVARDIAMHVAAMNPKYLKREEVDDEAMEKAKEVFAEEVADKPVDLQEKILSGKLDSYFKERILLEQAFIKNPDQTIADLVTEATQKFGEKTEIIRFVRFGVLEA